MAARRRSASAVIWRGVLAAVLVTVVLAPVISGGWCADAPPGGTSMCASFQRSVIGIDTNLWIWVGGLAVVLAITLLGALGQMRSRAALEHPR